MSNTIDSFNKLTHAESERLAVLLEEMGEAQQAIGKILRHGYESTHPDGLETNRELLELEMGDVYHAMIRMWASGDMNENSVTQSADDKAKSIIKYLHHQ